MTRFFAMLFAMLLQLFAENTSKEFPQSTLAFDSAQFQQDKFVSALVPVIIQENEQILKDRKFVADFFGKYDSDVVEGRFSKADFDKMMSVASKYKISNPFSKKEYDDKIDVVPVSLALSQAALESGWGESRVARRANNLFGQKTFSAKKELLSLDGEVKYAFFDDYMDAVKSYMLNLNSHEAYSEFRRKRAKAKVDNRLFSGISAATTLKNYSEIGRAYTGMLVELIQDRFKSFDEIKGIYSKSGFDGKFLSSMTKM